MDRYPALTATSLPPQLTHRLPPSRPPCQLKAHLQTRQKVKAMKPVHRVKSAPVTVTGVTDVSEETAVAKKTLQPTQRRLLPRQQTVTLSMPKRPLPPH